MKARQAVTLVTGASAGIGRELARLAARDSRALVLVARRRERLVALQEELVAAQAGLEVHPWACDLTDARERRALVAGLAAKGLAIDHLINNAGAGDTGAFQTLDRGRLQAQVELDVVAVHDLLLAFVPPMVERGYGRVLNVASTAAFQPLPWMATYAASKAFVLHLSEALSVELQGRGVTVTCLCPGRTATEFFDAAAGHDRIVFSRTPTADAGAVARAGYEAMLAGRRLVVPMLRDRLMAWSARVSPRRLVLAVTGRLFRPQGSERVERPRIAVVGSAFPPHYYDQERLIAAFRELWGKRHHNLERAERLHRNVLVGGRHLALPLEEYARLDTWGKANDAWIRVAQEVGAAAVEAALARAGLAVADVDALYTVTVTGVATPSLDARLINRLRLRPDLKRVPIFGLGCLAGAAGVARAADYLVGHPREVAVLLSVELCSLTLQPDDLSVPNLIASGLFGDGGAAAVLLGGERAPTAAAPGATGAPEGGGGPRVLASASSFYYDTERVMGWDISEKGFQVVLSAEVPEMVRRHLRADVDAFLAAQGLGRGDIASWVAHPGGPKVLEAMQEELELPDEALAVTWRGLREVGNLSSTSVLLVLQETMESHRPPPGSYGLLLAMGPGFCSELVLLRW